MRSWTGGFEVLAGGAGGGVGAGVFVVAEPDGVRWGGRGGPVGEFASGVLTHLADAPRVFVPAEARSQASAPRILLGAGQVRRRSAGLGGVLGASVGTLCGTMNVGGGALGCGGGVRVRGRGCIRFRWLWLDTWRRPRVGSASPGCLPVRRGRCRRWRCTEVRVRSSRVRCAVR